MLYDTSALVAVDGGQEFGRSVVSRVDVCVTVSFNSKMSVNSG